jgi:ribonuclease E
VHQNVVKKNTRRDQSNNDENAKSANQEQLAADLLALEGARDRSSAQEEHEAQAPSATPVSAQQPAHGADADADIDRLGGAKARGEAQELHAAGAGNEDSQTGAKQLPVEHESTSLTKHEQFMATRKLVFLAPDVPPVAPRPRHNELRQLDEMLDKHLRLSRQGEVETQDRGGRRDKNRGKNDGASFDDDRDSKRQGKNNGGADDSHKSESADSGSTRRRRRNRGGDDSGSADSKRSDQSQSSEPQKVKGSTRLEAKKQRRRDGREAGRRRSVITESEFLARRESVDRRMVVRTESDRVQIGVLEDKVLVEHYVARSSENSLIGNVYLGRVQNVLPSMEAAFVDIGHGRNAVVYSGEVDWSEYTGSNASRKIENVLSPGDSVLVQVTKDPVGHKGARLTSQISLPGRYLVFVPGGSMNGISRKLPDTERARLKKVLKEIVPEGSGVIVRTAAEGATAEQLTRDVTHLTAQWEDIQKQYKKGGSPKTLHAEPDMLIKIVRDVFNEDFDELVISGDDTYKTIESYLTKVAPDLLDRVTRYENERKVFDKYRVTEQIQKALDRKVWLPSGGSLVIDRTEAMTVIDVNTGKFVGSGGNLEETVTKNNLEAAEEIVRQLRLRDTGGIIVIDFIDMVLESNRELVHRRLVECLGRDRTKHQVAEVTSLGLVQMTRKKIGLGLLETFSEQCEVCNGRGVIIRDEPVVKHKHENGGKKRKNSRGSGKNNQENSNQAHEISDGAKNMLVQIAAKTINGTKDEPGAEDSAAVDADWSQSEPSKQQSQGSSRAQQGEKPQPEKEKQDQRKKKSQRAKAADRSKKQAKNAPSQSQEELDTPEREEAASAFQQDQTKRPEADAAELIAAIPRKDATPEKAPETEVSDLLHSLLDALPGAKTGGGQTSQKPDAETTAPQNTRGGNSSSAQGDSRRAAGSGRRARRATAPAGAPPETGASEEGHTVPVDQGDTDEPA